MLSRISAGPMRSGKRSLAFRSICMRKLRDVTFVNSCETESVGTVNVIAFRKGKKRRGMTRHANILRRANLIAGSLIVLVLGAAPSISAQRGTQTPEHVAAIK